MTHCWNTIAATLAMVCATLAGINWGTVSDELALAPLPTSQAVHFPQIRLPTGEAALVDASGHAIGLKHYGRIVSASTVADSLLLEFIERDRIVAFTEYSMNLGWHKHRYAGASSIGQLNDLEALLALRPDLVLANLNGSEQTVERLREAGIEVFNLGEMRGVPGFLASIKAIATLCERPELGKQYAQTFLTRLERIAHNLPKAQQKTAVYVALWGNKLYGSGRDTNYADILKYAGFIDKGAERFNGFPELSAEQLLSMNPEYIVTRTGNRALLCGAPALVQLAACADSPHRILELPEAIVSSTGAEMLIAAEQFHEFAYSKPASSH